MTPVLDPRRDSPKRKLQHDPRTCPECLATFAPVDRQQLFCSTEHRRAWNNRWTVRGARVALMAGVARFTRNGTRGDSRFAQRASRDADTLYRQWRDEDAAAGRMPWLDYIDARYAAGFDPI